MNVASYLREQVKGHLLFVIVIYVNIIEIIDKYSKLLPFQLKLIIESLQLGITFFTQSFKKNEELKLTLECDIKGVKRIKRNFQDSNIFYWIFKKKKTKNIEFEFKKTSYFSVKVL